MCFILSGIVIKGMGLIGCEKEEAVERRRDICFADASAKHCSALDLWRYRV